MDWDIYDRSISLPQRIEKRRYKIRILKCFTGIFFACFVLFLSLDNVAENSWKTLYRRQSGYLKISFLFKAFFFFLLGDSDKYKWLIRMARMHDSFFLWFVR